MVLVVIDHLLGAICNNSAELQAGERISTNCQDMEPDGMDFPVTTLK